MPEPEKTEKKSFPELAREARALEKKAVAFKPVQPEARAELHFVDPSPPDITALSYWDFLNELVKINKVRIALEYSRAIYASGKPRPSLFEKTELKLPGQGKGNPPDAKE